MVMVSAVTSSVGSSSRSCGPTFALASYLPVPGQGLAVGDRTEAVSSVHKRICGPTTASQ